MPSFSIVASGSTESPEQETALIAALREAVKTLPATLAVAEVYGESTGATNLLNGPAAPPAPDPGLAGSGVYVKDADGALLELTVAQLTERQTSPAPGA
jgi:hypothetical protein